MKWDWFEGKKRRGRPRRTTPAFRAMGCLTAVGAALTYTSHRLEQLLTQPRETALLAARIGLDGVPQGGGQLVLSRDFSTYTLGLGLLAGFFLLVWLVVIWRKL